MRFAAALVLGFVAAGAAEAQDLAGTLKKIRDTGVVTLGYREAALPFSFRGPEGKPAGYSVDLCTRVTEAVRRDLGLATLRLAWAVVTPETRIPALTAGTIDLECGSTTVTFGRQRQVDFSTLTFVDGGSLLTTVGSGISGVADLAGKRVAIIPGTTTEKALGEALQKAWVTNGQLVLVKEHADGLAAVEDGQADAYASDRIVLGGLLARAKDPARLRVSSTYFSYEPYALMIRRGDPDFRVAVNRALSNLYQSAHIAQIYETWFGPFSRASSLVQALYRLGVMPD